LEGFSNEYPHVSGHYILSAIDEKKGQNKEKWQALSEYYRISLTKYI